MRRGVRAFLLGKEFKGGRRETLTIASFTFLCLSWMGLTFYTVYIAWAKYTGGLCRRHATTERLFETHEGGQ